MICTPSPPWMSCCVMKSCTVWQQLTLRCLWMWEAISNMSSDWTASISCLSSANARTDGWKEKKRKQLNRISVVSRIKCIYLSVFSQDRHGIVTFALEKEIRHRQALSWASSFSRLSVVFLLGQTQTCNQVRVFNNSQTHAIISFVHIAIIINSNKLRIEKVAQHYLLTQAELVKNNTAGLHKSKVLLPTAENKCYQCTSVRHCLLPHITRLFANRMSSRLLNPIQNHQASKHQL